MKFKLRNVVVAGLLYLCVTFALISLGAPMFFLGVLYVGGCLLVMRWLMARAHSLASGEMIEFSKTNAASRLGSEWGSFHHVFYSKCPVFDKFRETLGAALQTKLQCPPLQEVRFKDKDRDLKQPEVRSFLKAVGPPSSRETGFILLCTFSRISEVQGVRWWVLVSGERDPNKVFWRYALAPISLPFVLLLHLRPDYDFLRGVTTIDTGFFNSIDILSRTREIHFVAFETLVETLESFGIDTSDLKQQKANILNVNVSGGQTTFGSVVQGAFNKAYATAGGTHA